MSTSLAIVNSGVVDVMPTTPVHPGRLFPAEGTGALFRQRFLHKEAKLSFLNCGEFVLPSGTESMFQSFPERETVLVVCKGEATAEIENQIFELSRFDVLYVPKSGPFRLRNQSHETTVVCQLSAPASGSHPPFHGRFLECSQQEDRTDRQGQRCSYLMFGSAESADKLTAGYTFHEPFSRTWPPVSHAASDQAFIVVQGRGSVEVYDTLEKLSFVREVKEGDVITVPALNYHGFFALADPLAYLWCKAGDRA